MSQLQRALALTMLGGLVLTTGSVAQITVTPEALFVPPADVTVNDLVPPPSPTYVGGFRGQPRIDNNGSWYALYGFPMSANPDPIEFTRDTVMLRDSDPYIREGLQIPMTATFAPIADYAYSQQPFFDISIASDGTIAQIIKGTDQFTVMGDGTPNPADIDYPEGQRDLMVVDRAVMLDVGSELDVLPGVEYPRNAIESMSGVKAADAHNFVLHCKLDTGEGQFESDTPVIVDISTDESFRQSVELRFTTEDTLPIPGLGYNLSSLNANEEDFDANADGSILIGVDIEGAPFDSDGAIVYYNALTDTYELIAREGDPSPLVGRNYDGLFNKPVALNDNGDIAFLASVDGDYGDDGIIVVNDAVVAQEAMTVGTAVPGDLQLGYANANIEMDNDGNIVWYGAWNELKENVCPDNDDIGSTYVIYEGIFYNDQVLIEGGVTEVHNVMVGDTLYPTMVVKDLPNNRHGGFHMSPDGRWLIVHALLALPSDDICAFSINNDATLTAQVLMRIDLSQIGKIPGDLDGDEDVDADDFLLFELCIGGPGVTTPPPACNPDHFAAADLEGSDGDVDLRDVAEFQAAFGQ